MSEGGTDPFAVMRLVDNRRALLSQLEQQPVDKPELVATLECSRSTVDRAIDQLSRHRLIERRCDGYTLTFPGRRVLEIYDQYYRQADTITSSAELLSTLPTDCTLLDELLWQGELIEGNATEPGAPQHALRRLIENAQRLMLSYPIMDSYAIGPLLDRLDTGRPTEILIDRPCFEYLSTAAPHAVDDLRDNDVLFVTDSLEYGVVYTDPKFAVILCGSDRQWCGLLVDENSTGLTWTKQAYRNERADGKPAGELETPCGG